MALTYVPRIRSFDQIVCIDFETYYSKTFSLRKKHISTTDYIRSPEFKAHCVGVQFDGWADPQVFAGEDIAAVLHDIDWSRTAFVGHHAHFDGLILTHHYGVVPAFWFDTLSMSRTVFGTDVQHSHAALCSRLGREGKTRAGALKEIEGKRDLTEEEIDELADYCGDDVRECLLNFKDLRPAVGEDELRIIDATVRMYTEPTLALDHERVRNLLEHEINTKAADFDAAEEFMDLGEFETVEERHEARAGALKSAEKFANQLRSLGVSPPKKPSPSDPEQRIYAFARGDLAFLALKNHPDARVRALIQGRIRAKSELIEARSRRILGYAGYPLPIYLGYWAAHTGRWGGGDKVNWQNLPRRGVGAELRRSILAPPGHLLVFSDASQIEARLNAWDVKQDDKLDAFAAGQDVYKLTAALIYGLAMDEISDDQRFVAKTLELGAGYGAGAYKVNLMFKLGQFGPPIDQDFEVTKELLYQWRRTNAAIVAKWKANEHDVLNAFLGQTSVESGAVVYEGRNGDGFMHMPGGTYIRYPNIWYDNDNRQLYCYRGQSMIKLYGGILTENKIQALARKLIVWQINEIEDKAADAGMWSRLVSTTHDELMYVTQEKEAEAFAKLVNEVMTSTPAWAEGLPVNAKTEVSPNYSKS